MSYLIPLAERESATISNFYRWEQAFRVFSNIYMEAYLGKANELVQYNHTIHTAAQTFVWDNVYRYDCEFRLHMSKHHLARSWAVFLQQAWSMCLKDKDSGGSGQQQSFGGSHSKASGARCKLCFDFNSGYCSYGQSCKFDHKCSFFCNKFGHGAHNCRRANGKFNKEKNHNRQLQEKGGGHSQGQNGHTCKQ